MFTKPRGTRDILPDEMEKRRLIEKKLRRTFERYAYGEIQTPVFEHLELITAKSGEDINDHLYSFGDKSQRKLALRPELSAPTMRLYAQELRTRPKPRKLYYFENCFRYERPQKGRYREFWQAGVELIGTARPEAEAEVLALADQCLKEVGLKDYSISIGHLGIIRGVLSQNGIDESLQNHILGLLDKNDMKAVRDVGLPSKTEELLFDLIGLKGSAESVLERLKDPLQDSQREDFEDFIKLLDYLNIHGVRAHNVDLGIARGLDYYTGMVFEIHAKGLGAQSQICGGGTYSLVKLMGGGDIPSCGFAFGFDRLMLALEAQGAQLESRTIPKVLVVPESEKVLNRAIDITRVLRKDLPCDLELMGRKLGKSLSYADSEGIPFVVIVQENAGGKVVVRDMLSGDQQTLGIEEVLDAIR